MLDLIKSIYDICNIIRYGSKKYHKININMLDFEIRCQFYFEVLFTGNSPCYTLFKLLCLTFCLC